MNRENMEAIAGVPRTGYDARFKNLRGTASFKVEAVGNWRLRIDDGHFEMFVDGEDVDPDLILSLDQETFIELIEGRQNFLTGVLQGRIRVEGDLALAFRFRGIFPLGHGPSKEVRP